MLDGKEAQEIRDSATHELLMAKGKKFTEKLIQKIDFSEVDIPEGLTSERSANNVAEKVLLTANEMIERLEEELEKEIDKIIRGDELKPGVLQLVKVYIAKKRKVSVGDKMAGRHGNKGVISKIVPVEDMPFMPDGDRKSTRLNSSH